MTRVDKVLVVLVRCGGVIGLFALDAVFNVIHVEVDEDRDVQVCAERE